MKSILLVLQSNRFATFKSQTTASWAHALTLSKWVFLLWATIAQVFPAGTVFATEALVGSNHLNFYAFPSIIAAYIDTISLTAQEL